MRRPPLARAPVLSAVAALAVVLAVTTSRYGYHRDELYFRMLPPAWGHLDQPPLTPLLAWGSAQVVDEVWALRIPAVVAACLTVLVVAQLTREVGGGRLAQGLSAWGFAFGSFTLSFGHVLLTSAVDLLLWPSVVLCAVRAVSRDRPRWWWLAGVLVGLGLYNKLLIVMLLVAIAAGLLALGPRRVLRSPHVWFGVGIAVVIGLPNLVHQALNDFPQLAMGAALEEENGGDVRLLVWPFLLVLLGPFLVPTWVAGIVALLRRPAWRELRFLVGAFAMLLALVTWAGTQFYYPYGLLVCLYAIGCVPVADWATTHVRRGLAGINQLTADQVGWPAYVAQIDRFGTTGVPLVSGHNALADLAAPAPDAEVAVVVGGQLAAVADLFDECRVIDALDNGAAVDNEEQGVPVAVCTGPTEPWAELWPQFAHLD